MAEQLVAVSIPSGSPFACYDLPHCPIDVPCNPQGADPWVADRSAGRTALHHAALAGSAACVRALLEALPPRHAVRGNTR